MRGVLDGAGRLSPREREVLRLLLTGPQGPEPAPSTVNLSIGSGWQNFGGDYQAARATRMDGVGAVLPSGFRPAARLIFVGRTNTGITIPVDVLPNGEIRAIDSVSAFLSLGLSFTAQ